MTPRQEAKFTFLGFMCMASAANNLFSVIVCAVLGIISGASWLYFELKEDSEDEEEEEE